MLQFAEALYGLFATEESEGQGLVEYALILALIAGVVVVSMVFLPGKHTTLFPTAGHPPEYFDGPPPRPRRRLPPHVGGRAPGRASPRPRPHMPRRPHHPAPPRGPRRATADLPARRHGLRGCATVSSVPSRYRTGCR